MVHLLNTRRGPNILALTGGEGEKDFFLDN